MRETEETRIGFSVSKKLGGAVPRNRIKRRLRAASRAILPRVAASLDIIVVGRSAIAQATVSDIEAALESQIRRAGALK
jgi:ribonuclease P protein component